MYVLENLLATRLGMIHSHSKSILSHVDVSSQKKHVHMLGNVIKATTNIF